MRTTVSLDDDVIAEVERVRREKGIGVSEAVNQLIRTGMSKPRRRTSYEHRSADVGLKVDVTNVVAVLDLLDND